jgi:hypothetical protein
VGGAGGPEGHAPAGHQDPAGCDPAGGEGARGLINSHAKLETPIAYMDADEFNAWWAKDAAKLAEVVRQIGKVE